VSSCVTRRVQNFDIKSTNFQILSRRFFELIRESVNSLVDSENVELRIKPLQRNVAAVVVGVMMSAKNRFERSAEPDCFVRDAFVVDRVDRESPFRVDWFDQIHKIVARIKDKCLS
jgi:hypothetical protein